MFVHFTSQAAAEAIIASGQLELSDTVVNAVFAAAVGGRSVPGVQHSRDGSRDVAVLFHADVEPDTILPEEVVWHRTQSLPIIDTRIIAAATADALLDDSAAIPDDGSASHPADCRCAGCVCYRTTSHAYNS